jgi:hypothetical protein
MLCPAKVPKTYLFYFPDLASLTGHVLSVFQDPLRCYIKFRCGRLSAIYLEPCLIQISGRALASLTDPRGNT